VTMSSVEPQKFLHSCNPPNLWKTTFFTRGDSFHWPWRNFPQLQLHMVLWAWLCDYP